MATPRIQWIQYNELVLGENNPTGEPDNDNRPLKQIVIFSNLNPQAEDFPGFIGCYQGTSDPNGTQVGNIRNGFWDAANGEFWMKQTGDNTNTGWIKIGGVGGDHLIGDGSPDGVRTADHVGKYYDQLDSAGEHPSYVKRSIEFVTPLSAEWFGSALNSDIAARVVDGGADALVLGTWLENTGAAGGQIDIQLIDTEYVAVPTFAGVNCYNLTGVTGLAVNQSVALRLSKWMASIASTEVGVGVRMLTSALTGYLATVRLDTGVLTIWKTVAGVRTSLATVAGPAAIGSNADWFGKIDLRAYDISSTVRLDLWWNDRKVLTVNDATYFGVVGTPAIWVNKAGGDTIYTIHEFYVGTANLTDDDTGWYGQNGFGYRHSVEIGIGSVAGIQNVAIEVGSIAIGYKASAVNPIAKTDEEFGAIAIGEFANASGPGDIAIGSNAVATMNESIAIGAEAQALSPHSTVIGADAQAFNADHSLVLGYLCTANGGLVSFVGAQSGTVIGYDSHIIKARFGIAIGCQAFVENLADDDPTHLEAGIAIGSAAIVNADHGIAIGFAAQIYASGSNGVALGLQASVSSSKGIAIGWNASSEFSHAGSIAIGAQAITTAANQLMLGGDDATDFIREVVFNGGSGSGTKGPNVVFGTTALATTATDGFIYIPTCAGPPTGVPTVYTGTKALVYDVTNHKLYIYDGGWKTTTVFA